MKMTHKIVAGFAGAALLVALGVAVLIWAFSLVEDSASAATSLFAVLVALAFAYLIYRELRQRIRNLVHLKTEHLLEAQKQTNEKLERANATLQEEEQRLAVTLNSIGDGVIATDAAARITRLNPVAEKLTGWTQAEACGRPVDEVFHIISQDTRQLATLPVLETLAHGTI